MVEVDTFDMAAERLRELSRGVHRLAMTGRTWTPESPAAVEVAADTYGGAWGARPVHETLMLVLTSMTHVNDHLLGMAATIGAEGVVMSTVSLMRPALESTATAFYLLEPDVDLRERVRRGMNVLLRSYNETLNLVSRPGGPSCQLRGWPAQSASEFRARQRIVWTRMGAERHGFTVHTAKRRPAVDVEPARWIDTPIPSEQRLIRALLDAEGATGATGALMHRITSAVVHGQVHGFQLFVGRHDADGAEDGNYFAEVGISLGDLARWSGGLIYGLHTLMLRACSHYGWSVDEWQEIAQPALIDWRRWVDLPGLPKGLAAPGDGIRERERRTFA